MMKTVDHKNYWWMISMKITIGERLPKYIYFFPYHICVYYFWLQLRREIKLGIRVRPVIPRTIIEWRLSYWTRMGGGGWEKSIFFYIRWLFVRRKESCDLETDWLSPAIAPARAPHPPPPKTTPTEPWPWSTKSKPNSIAKKTKKKVYEKY